jgi:hypothetical protein
MIFCNADCDYSKLTWEGESVCTGYPILSSFNSNRLECSNFKERTSPQEELHPGRKPNGLFPGQLEPGGL